MSVLAATSSTARSTAPATTPSSLSTALLLLHDCGTARSTFHKKKKKKKGLQSDDETNVPVASGMWHVDLLGSGKKGRESDG
jgi:hypothetical protein